MKHIRILTPALIAVFFLLGVVDLSQKVSFYISPFHVELSFVAAFSLLYRKEKTVPKPLRFFIFLSFFCAIVGIVAMFIELHPHADAILSIVSGVLLVIVSVLRFNREKQAERG
jgi:peptidoglycan/LPS O-acetylase OafA/YrhL